MKSYLSDGRLVSNMKQFFSKCSFENTRKNRKYSGDHNPNSLSCRPQVAKDVSIRLHSQLDSVEKKRSGLEQENEELRVRLQDLEVARQVLQQEIDKVGRPRGEAELGGSLTTGPCLIITLSCPY